MKKLLISLIIILSLVLTGITIVKGLQIGKINVLGILGIKEENEKLDEKVKEATKLASTDYQKNIDDLNSAIKKLETEKSSYEDLVNVSTDSEVESANQNYNYMIDFLLIRVENHAKSVGVTMKMDVTRSSSGAENVYNLNFTATGSYVGIEEFITGIEDDSKLGFKIENFSMKSSSENGGEVQATFVCKDITIQGISNNNSSSSSTTDRADTKDPTNPSGTEQNTTTTQVDTTDGNNNIVK